MDVEAEIRSWANQIAVAAHDKEQLRDVLAVLGPVLVDGFADLLAARPVDVDPLTHLAIYLMRHHPRHAGPGPSRLAERETMTDRYLGLYKDQLTKAMAAESVKMQ